MTDAPPGLSLWATLGLRMTGLVVLAVVVTTAGAAQGQAPATSYEMSLYNTAATAPFVVREIPLASLTCGQDPPKQAPVPGRTLARAAGHARARRPGRRRWPGLWTSASAAGRRRRRTTAAPCVATPRGLGSTSMARVAVVLRSSRGRLVKGDAGQGGVSRVSAGGGSSGRRPRRGCVPAALGSPGVSRVARSAGSRLTVECARCAVRRSAQRTETRRSAVRHARWRIPWPRRRRSASGMT